MTSVFISYSSNDKEFARKLASDLAVRGIDTWIDETEIRVGDSIIQKIDEGIRKSDYLIVLLSESSVKSKWVQQEIRMAYLKDEDANRVLIPVVLENIQIPLFLSTIKYLDFTKLEYADGVNEIVKRILSNPVEKTQKPTQLINVGDLAKEVALEVAHILKVSPQGIREENNLTNEIDPQLVFVIISFKPDMEPIYQGIKAAGDVHGLRVFRVKDVHGDYKITSKIIEMIHKARLIVADLTHESPNVYFELGYARGIGKTVITTAREGTNLHFDVKDWVCTFYNDSRVLEQHLLERFAFEIGKTESG